MLRNCETNFNKSQLNLAGTFKAPPGPPCANPNNGQMTFCIKMKLFLNCPTPVKNDAECDKVKTFIDCVENKKQ